MNKSDSFFMYVDVGKRKTIYIVINICIYKDVVVVYDDVVADKGLHYFGCWEEEVVEVMAVLQNHIWFADDDVEADSCSRRAHNSVAKRICVAAAAAQEAEALVMVAVFEEVWLKCTAASG